MEEKRRWVLLGLEVGMEFGREGVELKLGLWVLGWIWKAGEDERPMERDSMRERERELRGFGF